MRGRPITALVAVLFAALTVAAYGSGTGPGTTGNAGGDELVPTREDAAAVRVLQTIEQEPPATPPVAAPTGPPAAVPQAPADDPAPAARMTKHAKRANVKDADENEDKDDGEGGGKGRGLGKTYCQSLKGTGGPAFGQCIAAKAHELHGRGKHR